MATGFIRTSGGTMAAGSAGSSDFCQAGPACYNPVASLKPTRLSTEDSLSTSTGYCSYCRKAGVAGSGGDSRGSLHSDHHASAGSVLMTPPEEAEAPAVSPAPFDASEYDNFDPFADGHDVPKPAGQVDEDDMDFASQAAAAHARPSEDDGLTSASMSFVPPSKQAADESTPKKKRAPRGSGKKSKKTSAENPAAAVSEFMPLSSLSTGETGQSTEASPASSASPASLSSLPHDISSGGAETAPEPRQVKSPAAQETVKGPEAPARPAPVPQAPSRPSLTAPVQKDQQGRLGRILGKLKPKPLGVRIADESSLSPAASEALAGGLEFKAQRPQASLGLFRRIGLGLVEGGRGTLDVVTSLGRIFSGPPAMLFVAAGTALSLSASLLLFKFDKVAGHIAGGIKDLVKLARYTTLPFSDGRVVPASTICLTMLATAFAPSLSPPMATAAIVLGLAGSAGWVAWRGARAMITGTKLRGLRRDWAKEWTNTSDMNSQQVTRLNHAFERTVAEAFAELGFKTQLHGTQQAKANGHVGPGDGGFDIMLQDSNNQLSLVSCKRLADNVGVKEVRDILAVCKDKKFANLNPMPILVTTVGFSSTARDFANRNSVKMITINPLMEQASRHSA